MWLSWIQLSAVEISSRAGGFAWCRHHLGLLAQGKDVILCESSCNLCTWLYKIFFCEPWPQVCVTQLHTWLGFHKDFLFNLTFMVQCNIFMPDTPCMNTEFTFRLSQTATTETGCWTVLQCLYTCLAKLTPDVLCFSGVQLECNSHLSHPTDETAGIVWFWTSHISCYHVMSAPGIL